MHTLLNNSTWAGIIQLEGWMFFLNIMERIWNMTDLTNKQSHQCCQDFFRNIDVRPLKISLWKNFMQFYKLFIQNKIKFINIYKQIKLIVCFSIFFIASANKSFRSLKMLLLCSCYYIKIIRNLKFFIQFIFKKMNNGYQVVNC